MAYPDNSGLALRIFCRMKGANRYMKILLVVFRENSFGAIFLGHFLLFDWAWSKFSQATVTIRSLDSQDMITSGSLNN